MSRPESDTTANFRSPEARSQPEDPFDPSRGPIRLGHHILLSTLGRGGMGVVYSAYDEKLGRNVAIKLLRTHRRERERRRLVREAQALARLSHPNVVQIYEICEHEQVDYLVMERVEGLTLAQWLARQPRARKDILDVFLAAGAGLAAAHAKDIVHRDFKPDNVMLREDGQVLVMDFGLARDGRSRGDTTDFSPDSDSTSGPDERDRDSDEFAAALTREGVVVGSVGYMAPEQVSGRVADDRSDQFSFCVSVWEAVHGQRPFGGSSMPRYTRAVLNGTPSVPQHSDVPRWLRQVLERGLSREPDQRWASMHDLLAALQRDPTRRRRGWLAFVGIAVLVGASAVGWQVQDQRERERAIADCEALSQSIDEAWNDEVAAGIEQAFLATKSNLAVSAWQHTRPWLDTRAEEWARLRRETCVETRVDRTRSEDELADIASCLDEQRSAFVELLEVLADADEAMVQGAAIAAAGLPPLSHCTNAEMLAHRIEAPDELAPEIAALHERLQRVDALRLVGEFERALAEAREAADLAEPLDWLPLQAEAWLAIAAQEYELGRYDDASVSAQRAFRLAAVAHDGWLMLVAATELTKIGAELSPVAPAADWGDVGEQLITRLGLSGEAPEGELLAEIAKVKYRQGSYPESRVDFARALAILESTLGPDHPHVGWVLLGFGAAYLGEGKLDDALATWRRQLAIFERVLGPDSFRLVNVLNNLGVVSMTQGNREAALGHYRRALALIEAALGPGHPKAASVLTNIGSALYDLHEYDAALIHLERALAIQEATVGSTHGDLAIMFDLIGMVRAAKGDHEAAIVASRRAIEIVEIAWGLEHPELIEPHTHLGNALHELGDFEAAERAHRRALNIAETTDGLDPIEAVDPMIGLGRAELELGRLDLAQQHLERALAIFPDKPTVGRALTRFDLGRVAQAQGDSARARELVESARTELSGLDDPAAIAQVEAWMAEK